MKSNSKPPANSGTDSILKVTDLVAGYPGNNPILQRVSLDLKAGEVLGIAGPNGAGKSTLLKALCGLLKPSSGEIFLHGESIEQLSSREHASMVATVIQQAADSLPFTVRDYVSQGRYPHVGALGKMGPEDEVAVNQAIQDCSVHGLANKLLGELSAGEAQRTYLAQAVAQQSTILILDEPNVHLDLQHQEHLSSTLQKMAKVDGKAIIVVLHDLELAKTLCDRVILLSEGSVLSEGDPEDVLNEQNLDKAYPPIPQSTNGSVLKISSPALLLTILPILLLMGLGFLSLQTGEMGAPGFKEILQVFLIKLGILQDVEISPLQTIFWELRLPRTLLGMLVGANIAVAGALMQGYFRNPLAEPYVAGVSAGAACGAVLVLTTSLSSLPWIPSSFVLPLFAFLGATLATWFVYRISTRHGQTSTTMLLLGGIAIGGILQAITIGLLLQSEPHNMQNVLSWLMGSLAYRGWEHIPTVAIGGFFGLTISLVLSRPLDLLATDGENAITLGLPVQQVRQFILATACFLAATSVASCGIIAFVGLMAPHIVRMIYGAKHIHLIPQTAILGALLLTFSDILARMILPSQELPIGIITGVIGALFLLFLIARKNTKNYQ